MLYHVLFDKNSDKYFTGEIYKDKTWENGPIRFLQDFFPKLVKYNITFEESIEGYYQGLLDLGLPPIENLEFEPVSDVETSAEVIEYYKQGIFHALESFRKNLRIADFYFPFTNLPEVFFQRILKDITNFVKDYSISYIQARKIWARYRPNNSPTNLHKLQYNKLGIAERELSNGMKILKVRNSGWWLRSSSDKQETTKVLICR